MADANLDERVHRCADPQWVEVGIERLDDARTDAAERLAADDDLASATVAVMAASRSMTNLLIADELALETLADLDRREPVDAGSQDRLAAWKRREYLRIAARDLTGRDRLEDTGELLSAMAGDVLHAAVLLVGAVDLAVIGMGKLAGRELNYASDVDIVFVTDGNLQGAADAARALLSVCRASFRVDTELRPEGKDGPLVRNLDSYRAYWDQWAEPWEFQSLLKTHPVAGLIELGDEWRDAAAERLWHRSFSADDLQQLRHLKSRAEAIVRKKGLEDQEVKRGPGGIRDVEFTVQLLQLVHGRHDPSLRSPNTLTTLAALAQGGYVDADDADVLADGYRFLRSVEHALQLVQEQQTHTVPSDEEARARLARVLGFRPDRRSSELARFDRELRSWQGRVREIHERLYFRPLLESFTAADFEVAPSLDPADVETRMQAMGFGQVDRARAAVTELTRGLGRGARAMHQLLPLLLKWLADTPDPDLGLLNLRFHTDGRDRARMLAHHLRDSPETVRRLAVVLGSSRAISDLLLRHSDVGDELRRLERSGEADIEPLLRSTVDAAAPDMAGRALRLAKERVWALIAAADLVGLIDVDEVGRRLAALADACVAVALDLVAPAIPVCVVAMGRYGGSELSYSSDLDLVFTYDGGTATDQGEGDRVAREIRALLGPIGPDRLYEIDLNLRPEGSKGSLSRSLNGFRLYFERWAEVWERQAMIRARRAAGDTRTWRGFVLSTAPLVWGQAPTDDELDQIGHIHRRIRSEKLPDGVLPSHHLKVGPGGLVDVEFAVQVTQLRTGARGQNTLDALENLARRGHVARGDADALAASYRSALRMRNRLFLLGNRRPDVVPRDGAWLHKLGVSLQRDPAALVEERIEQATAAAHVAERLLRTR